MSVSLSQQYQKKTDREHILDAPDTYIGSIEKDKVQNWNIEEDKIKHKSFEFIPGLYKCFDEGIVNARDHFIRMQMQEKNEKVHHVSYINVDVDKENGMISITNDGNGIDIEKHPEHQIWIPEMIFGHLRTSTNYQKDQVRIVGGKNGFGFKLVLIYSLWGRIETVDHVRGLKYVQEFKDNLTVIDKPKITKCKGKPYTKVSWIPDYKRFGINRLTEDMENIFHKRVIDISATTEKSLKVKYNKSLVPVQSFEQYVNMYVGNKTVTKRIYEKGDERWEYAVCLTPFDEFTQVSFVNGICTTKGGKHVDYILNQITKQVVEHIEKKKKVKVKPISIKEQLFLFVNCIIDNPSFDSQTKDTLTTNVAKFGSTCKVSEKFVDKICKLGVVDQALSIHNVKETKESKKTDGKKTKSLYGIPKLIDAHYAGTNKSKQCILILCEGDSAKAGIVSGLSKEDRNTIGVYPLRGKLMNARDAQKAKLNANNEIAEIKKIMGLETNRQYTSKEEIATSLRYGQIVLLTDQDLDGVHIKGLCVNLFDSHWNSLVKESGFIGFMNTPILKAKKGNKEIVFYNENEYKNWKNTNQKGWTIKYYKGLGTSTSKEFKEYFKDKKIIAFHFDESSSDALDMVFRKTRSEDRKTWLENYDKDASLDTKKTSITYNEFVHNELIHFSKYDCERSIPNIVDGLKTSQRKILYCAFKRNLNKEIKVAQFGGYVSEHSGYHHGETSLMQAMVSMAQNFVGSNNINLLQPNGQFGTRLQGGSDSASERYIFTQLNPLTRLLFPESDDSILKYLNDDGQSVEPEFYMPILPMILVNGALGIGTGFSTYIPQFNPLDIIQYIKNSLNQTSDRVNIIPWYRNFKGKIHKLDDQNMMLIKGVYELSKNQLRVTELPVGTWTDSYKAFLEKHLLSKNSVIKEYQDMSTDVCVDIRITLNKTADKLIDKKVEYDCNALEKELNLYTTKKYNNMHLFDENQQLRKFATPEAIVDYYIPIRMMYYERRISAMLKIIQRECDILQNKTRFIEEQCNDIIDLRKKKKDDVVILLSSRNYSTIGGEDMEFKYLRNMPLDSLVEDNIIKLNQQRKDKEDLKKKLESTTPKMMWLQELDKFVESYSS